jgi:hypothetical protein
VSKSLRLVLMVALVVVVVAAGVMVGCGKSKEKTLQKLNVSLAQYLKGSTVDFDDATVNSAASGGGEPGFLYGTAMTIYADTYYSQTALDDMAATLFPPPYVILPTPAYLTKTTYAQLQAADQTTVQAYIFASMPEAEQTVVNDAVTGFWNRYDADLADAIPMDENTAYGILASSVSSTAADEWAADAEAWMAALEAAAQADYGVTYANATYAEKMTLQATVLAAGNISPELAFYKAMTADALRNGTASSTYPTQRDAEVALLYPGKTYAQLNPVTQAPVVDAYVWAGLTDAQKGVVNAAVEGLFNLAMAENTDNTLLPLTSNVCYTTLLTLPPLMGGGQAAANAWVAAVTGTTPGTGAEALAFYEQLGAGDPAVGQATWKSLLSYNYYGTMDYSSLTTDEQAVIDQADAGMMGLATVQRLPALPLDQNVIYTEVLAAVGPGAQAGWVTDVQAGMNMEWATYKWMAYESFRNGTAASQYPTATANIVTALVNAGIITQPLDAYENMIVAAVLWNGSAAMGLTITPAIDPLGPHEQGYVTGAVLPGLWGEVQAEMTDAVPLDQTIAYLTLYGTVSYSAAEGFVTYVEAGTHPHTAFYTWLAREALIGLKGLGLLIELSMGEFDLMITNPNDYDVSIDTIDMNVSVNVPAQGADVGTDVTSRDVDAAKLALGDAVWVPANGSIDLHLIVSMKTLDMLTWLIVGPGLDATTSGTYAAIVWSELAAGTAVWNVSVVTSQTSENGEQNIPDATYTLTWTPS